MNFAGRMNNVLHVKKNFYTTMTNCWVLLRLRLTPHLDGILKNC